MSSDGSQRSLLPCHHGRSLETMFLLFANCCLILSSALVQFRNDTPLSNTLFFFVLFFLFSFYLLYFLFSSNFFLNFLHLNFISYCIQEKKSFLEDIKQIMSRDVDKIMHYFISEVLAFTGQILVP